MLTHQRSAMKTQNTILVFVWRTKSPVMICTA